MRKKLINFPLTLGNYKNFFFFIMKGTCQNYFLRDYWILLLFFYAITLRCIYLVVMYGRHIYKRGLSVGIFNCMKPRFPTLRRTGGLCPAFLQVLPVCDGGSCEDIADILRSGSCSWGSCSFTVVS